MALSAGAYKTEHGGAKRRRGAWCRKAVAKFASRRRRRMNDKKTVREAAADIR